MTQKYRCPICGEIYDDMSQDGFCSKAECYGVGLLETYDDSSASSVDISGKESISIDSDKIGLCVLVCDASGSMETPAFPGNPATRVRLVANAAAAGISDLYAGSDVSEQTFSKPEEAYIAIVAFGETAALIKGKSGELFIKTVAQIQNDFPMREDLAEFLYHSLTDECPVDRGYTDITKALMLAKKIQTAAIEGDFSAYGISGDFRVMEHELIEKETNQMLSVPNTRVLIYSDGGHNPGDRTPLENPFETEELSTLMTSFFGNPDSSDTIERKGADEMRTMACLCPKHKMTGYFLINTPQRYAMLRGLFRMASGASGFCPACLKDVGLGDS